jgi:hypothetical protein
MATCLFVLIKLENIELGFRSPTSPPDQESRHPHSQRCVILPSLTQLWFQDASEYLEGLVAWIYATPLLFFLEVRFFVEPIFHTQHLSQFISRVPNFLVLNEAHVVISFLHSSWQPSSLAQLYASSLLLFPMVENLHVKYPYRKNINNTERVEIYTHLPL